MSNGAEFSDFNARLALFEIDEETRRLLAVAWPLIAPQVARGVDGYFESCKALPRAAERLLPHRATMRALYMRHFEVVLHGQFDQRYVESFQSKHKQEVEIGLGDARTSICFSNFVLRAAIDVLCAHHRFSAPKAGQCIAALTQALAFDAATAVAAAADSFNKAAALRRRAIDEAIGTLDETVR